MVLYQRENPAKRDNPSPMNKTVLRWIMLIVGLALIVIANVIDRDVACPDQQTPAVADDTAARLRLAESPRVGPEKISFKCKAAERDQIALAHDHLHRGTKDTRAFVFRCGGGTCCGKALVSQCAAEAPSGGTSRQKTLQHQRTA